MPSKTTSLPTWVQLYFVLASLIGLIMLVMGSSMAINTLLSQYFFTPQQIIAPPPRPFMVDQPAINTEKLSEEQQAQLIKWQEDYETWQNAENEIDYEAESRKRTLATALAMILVGGPVFLIHVPFVFRQTRKD